MRFSDHSTRACALVVLAITSMISQTAFPQSIRQVTEADLPRIPPTEPADALQTFELAQGFRLELVAAEPLVADPVDACFDEFGRMFVAEMHGYPFSQEPTKLNPKGGGLPDAGIIRMLSDQDGDGRMETSVVFADKISWPTSVCCYRGGLFVLAPPYLYYLKDVDGDHRADVREIVLSGFGRDNVQSLANGLRWGLDNGIYFAAGRNPAVLLHRGQPLFTASGRDVRFDPTLDQFELVSGGQQFGHSLDDWGNRFVCSNSNHIQHVVFPQKYLSRNPYLAVSSLVRDIAVDGARVFRASPPEPWRIIRQKWRAAEKGYRLTFGEDGVWKFIPLDPAADANAVPTEYPVGYFTSATGVTIYRGSRYPEPFRGNAFVGDVGGNLVHRKTLTPRGVTFAADRADENQEFLRSTDNWFRPVNFVNAPDGTLYVLDMYRETVEHPYSIPETIKQFLHLRSGHDRGRIYRMVAPESERRPVVPLGTATSQELVRELESADSWRRETAQRLLCERHDLSVVEALVNVSQSSQHPLARVHALYTLSALDALNPTALRKCLRDADPRVREHVIRLSEPLLVRFPELVRALVRCCHDPDDRVRFQLAFTLGAAPAQSVLDGMVEIAFHPRLPAEIRTALLSALPLGADGFAKRLLLDQRFDGQAQVTALLHDLCLIAGAHPDSSTAAAMLGSVTSPIASISLQSSLLAALGEGLSRRGASLVDVLHGKSGADASTHQQVAALFGRAGVIAHASDHETAERVAAVGLFAFVDYSSAEENLAEFLWPQAPRLLQLAAIRALGFHTEDRSATLLLRSWASYSPPIRQEVVDALFRHPGHVRTLLQEIDAGRIPRNELTQEELAFLVSHPVPEIRAKSRQLFAGDRTTDRSSVVTSYQPALELTGDQARGSNVFAKQCATCHRVGALGHQVAPDLASASNKSPADLLIAILDPNREAQPNYSAYTLITNDGRVHRGMITAETEASVTLRRAEGKEDVILRGNIEELSSTGKSLMPEGLEKVISPQDVADLIRFIKSIPPT